MRKMMFLGLAVFLLLLGLIAQAQSDKPTAADIMKNVAKELFYNAGSIHPVVGAPLALVETLTIDKQMYTDVAGGLNVAINGRDYEWGENVVEMPGGKELFDVYQQLVHSHLVSRDDRDALSFKMQYTEADKWTLGELPESIQDKLQVLLAIGQAPNREQLIEEMLAKINERVQSDEETMDKLEETANYLYRPAEGEELFGGFSIPSDGETVPSPTLAEDTSYRFVFSGIFQYDEEEAGEMADAVSCEHDDNKWRPRNWIQLNGSWINPSASNSAMHDYSAQIEGKGEPASLRLVDDGYDDNQGSVYVRIFKVADD